MRPKLKDRFNTWLSKFTTRQRNRGIQIVLLVLLFFAAIKFCSVVISNISKKTAEEAITTEIAK